MEDERYRQVILESIEAMLEVQLKSVRQLLGRDARIGTLTRRKVRKRKSLVDLSVEALTNERRPVHVDELVELLKERHGRLTDRDSLSSALAKKDRQGILVRRVAPGSFIAREEN
jgi:hypothetical protein